MDSATATVNQMSYNSGNKHGIKALSVMNELRLRREFCDVIVRVGGTDIHAHKIVLVSMCPYFMAMFTGDMKERAENVVHLKDLDPTCVEQLIEYVYTGKVTLTEGNVQNMLYTASFLQLADVQNACGEFLMLQLHPSNCLGIHALAQAHACDELSEVAGIFIRENFLSVIESEEYLKLLPSKLEEILADDNLKIEREEDVYLALMKWIKHDITTRKDNIANLLTHVRLVLLSPEFLIDTVGKEKTILDDTAARCILDKAKDFLILPQCWISSGVTPRCSKVLTLVTIGGMENSGLSVDTVELFHPHSGVVDYTKARMNCKRSGLGVAVLHGKIYAVGGHDGTQFLNSVECYDPRCNVWKPVSPMNNARRYVGVTTWKNLVCAVGGHDGFNVLDTFETYDPSQDRWQMLPRLNQRRRHVAIHNLNGLLYAVGGHDGSNYLHSVERYDGNTWQMITSMHSPRAGVAVTGHGGVLYAVGGYDGKENLSTCERYYPCDDRWTKIAPMNVTRSGHNVNVICHRLCVSGGHDGQNYLNTIEWYHPILGEWKFVGNLGSCRAVAGTCVLDR